MGNALWSTIKTEDDTVPIEYVRFCICREFGYTPKQLDEMDATTFWLFYEFLTAEAKADRMKT